jgi:hypothetical protein
MHRGYVYDAYVPLVKIDSDGEYPRRFNLKIQELYVNGTRVGKPDIKVYSSISDKGYVKKNVNSYEELVALVPPNSYVKAIFKPYIWFNKFKKFGLSMKIIQLLIENN